MIPCPPTWTSRLSGDYTVFLPPATLGPRAGIIRYRERTAPVRRLSDVLRGVLAADPDFVPGVVEAPIPVQTAEGEYAALLALSGTYQGQPAQRLIGSVFAEDFGTELDVLIPRPERREVLQRLAISLLESDVLQLGARRRRYLYSPPADWLALGRGLAGSYYAPETPKISSMLTVPPAEPTRRSLLAHYTALVKEDTESGLSVEQEYGPDPISSDFGLHGRQWYSILQTTMRVRVFRCVVCYQDETYTYLMRLDCQSQAHISAHQQALLVMARSARPLPQVAAKQTQRVPAGLWTE